MRCSTWFLVWLFVLSGCDSEDGAARRGDSSSSSTSGPDVDCTPGAECPAPPPSPCQGNMCDPFPDGRPEPEDQCVVGRIVCGDDGPWCSRTDELRVGLPCETAGGPGLCTDEGQCCAPSCAICGAMDGCGSICQTGACEVGATCVGGECVLDGAGGGSPTTTGSGAGGGGGGGNPGCTDLTYCLETPFVTNVTSPSPCPVLEVGFSATNTCDLPMRCAIAGWEGTPDNIMAYEDIHLLPNQVWAAAVLWCSDAIDQQGVTKRCAAEGDPSDCISIF